MQTERGGCRLGGCASPPIPYVTAFDYSFSVFFCQFKKRVLHRKKWPTFVVLCYLYIHEFRNCVFSSDPQERTWNFALEDYDVLMRKVQCLKGAVSISGLPDYVLKVSLWSKGIFTQ